MNITMITDDEILIECKTLPNDNIQLLFNNSKGDLIELELNKKDLSSFVNVLTHYSYELETL